ncbi:quinoprotein dehydrogenase-associated SoxYZ-like carrier [Roseibium sp.]|uniref:quinoprotein dehydrogenase-associated SoxYZ-like carrier n=1 Tax=Roseibium sp. TaxID=1936156 RepID=UPI003A97D48F
MPIIPRKTGFGLVGALLLASLPPALAQQNAPDPAWNDIKASLYEGRFLASSEAVIRIDAPYRTDNDARTLVTVDVTAPAERSIVGVALILDNNPMPVSADLKFAAPQAMFDFTATMRINGPTPVHAVAELDNGQLFVAETFVKTSGLGACSAPPGTDPKEALQTLGQMEMALKTRPDTRALVASVTSHTPNAPDLEIAVSHPSHSGMQMDQISLLYIPARFIDTLELDVNGAPFATMTGSISLSENPTLTFSVPNGTSRAKARLTDTDGAVSEVEQEFADY